MWWWRCTSPFAALVQSSSWSFGLLVLAQHDTVWGPQKHPAGQNSNACCELETRYCHLTARVAERSPEQQLMIGQWPLPRKYREHMEDASILWFLSASVGNATCVVRGRRSILHRVFVNISLIPGSVRMATGRKIKYYLQVQVRGVWWALMRSQSGIWIYPEEWTLADFHVGAWNPLR